MERVYLDKEEFQTLVNEGFKDTVFTYAEGVFNRDPELEGLRVFEYGGRTIRRETSI